MRESAFQFNSMFRYNSVPSYDDQHDHHSNAIPLPHHQLIIHYTIVVAFYLILIVTFPISAIFCVKRINSLQRCIIFRLGLRLPLKGPGLVISFPCIDSVEIIDLGDQQITIVDKDQQLLTSDGSIIQFTSMIVTLNVTNAIKSSTQLKDAKFNCEQFVKLAFANMIGSSQIEDIEAKTEIVVQQFEKNCNMHLNNWGWNIQIEQMPKYVIIDRANPITPLLSTLKSIFNYQNDAIGSNDFLSKLIKSPNITSSDTENGSESNYNDNIIASLESIANKYSTYVFHDLNISIQIEQINSIQYFIFVRKSGKIKSAEKPNKIHISITAKTKSDLMLFCNNGDITKVNISSSLF